MVSLSSFISKTERKGKLLEAHAFSEFQRAVFFRLVGYADNEEALLELFGCTINSLRRAKAEVYRKAAVANRLELLARFYYNPEYFIDLI